MGDAKSVATLHPVLIGKKASIEMSLVRAPLVPISCKRGQLFLPKTVKLAKTSLGSVSLILIVSVSASATQFMGLSL